MQRSITFVIGLAFILSGSVLHAQTQFSIRAASDEAVPGWERMEFDNHPVWVSPTVSLTAADIARTQLRTDQDGRTFIGVVFTEPGAKKMRDLSAEQMNKLIAMVLDGKVIFAPKIRSQINTDAVITGSGPNGLSAAAAQRILASLNEK